MSEPGKKLRAFVKGWACVPASGWITAHYFHRQAVSDMARSRCGKAIHVANLFEPGDYRRCGRCEQNLERRSNLVAP